MSNEQSYPNPLDFGRDLDDSQRQSLELFTQFARRRLLEREVSVADQKKAFFQGEKSTVPPLLIADFPARLIGTHLRDYYIDTVKHYQAYCAALARFGEDYVFTYTATWEYRLVEALGGQVTTLPDKAPETMLHPFNDLEDLEKAPSLDIPDLLNADLALKRYTDKMLGDLIGPGMFVTLDPFSQVCSLLRDPQKLMMDIVERPEFVHALCTAMCDILIEVMGCVLATGPTVFFMPGYLLMISARHFDKFALPYINRLVEKFPDVPIMLGSGGDATHLIEPLMRSKVPIVFIDGATKLDVAVEKAQQYNKPITVLFPRTVLMANNKAEIYDVTRGLFKTVRGVPFYYWTEAILGGDIPNQAIESFINAYKDLSGASDDVDEKADESSQKESQTSPTLRNGREIPWDEEAENALNKSVPFMFRKMVRKEIQKKAVETGSERITLALFLQMKKQAGY